MSQINYTARVLVFRFTDSVGTVTLPPFGAELVFDSNEITTVEIGDPGKSEVIETETGAVSVSERVPDRWRVTARTYTADTYQKFFYLLDQVTRGHAIRASLDPALGYNNVSRQLFSQSVTFQNAAIDWQGDTYRRLRGARGYEKRLEVSFDVVRSAAFVLPGQGGGGGGQGGGGQQLGGN